MDDSDVSRSWNSENLQKYYQWNHCSYISPFCQQESLTSDGLSSIFIGKQTNSDLDRPSLDFHQKERSPTSVDLPSIFIKKQVKKHNLNWPSLDFHRKEKSPTSVDLSSIFIEKQAKKPNLNQTSLDFHREERSLTSVSLSLLFIGEQQPDLNRSSNMKTPSLRRSSNVQTTCFCSESRKKSLPN